MDSQDNKRKWKNRDLLSSLDFALTGIFTAIKEERNMRKHAVTSLLVLLAGIVFQVSRIEWLFLLLSIFLVIAFDEEDLEEDPDLAEMMPEFDAYIGELFISIDKAKEQAEEYGHSFEREMGFLAVHGFLHINGYDHYTPEEEAEMFGLQEEILTAYGLTRQ